MAKTEVSSNIAQTDLKWSLIVISSNILIQFSQHVDQNQKMAKSEVGLNIAQTDSKRSLIVIASEILVQFRQNMTKIGKWPKLKSVRTWLKLTPNSP